MPVRDVLLDSDGNRVLVAGDYGRADGIQAVKQGIECRVKMFLGEYWLDEAQGVAWLSRILIRNPNPLVIKAEISRAIAATPDVTRTTNVSYTPPDASRHAAIAYEAATNLGTVAGSVTA